MGISVQDELRSVVGPSYCFTAYDQLYNYSNDCTSEPEIVPEMVLLPGTVSEISQIVKICNRNKIAITVRGGGTGVSGGALAYNKGIIISLERLDKIIELNTLDRMAIIEAGVITKTIQDAALLAGLCFPQNISSAASSFIGGNVAVSSGSPKSLKYGTTKNFIINLEVVLPDGEVIWTGKNVRKNASGYNLTQLFIGSEGTLGIITKVVLKLVPARKELLMLVPFKRIDKLFDFVHSFFQNGYEASSIEFIDKMGTKIVAGYVKGFENMTNGAEGLLWIELEGKSPEALLDEAMKLNDFINTYTGEQIFIAQTEEELSHVWSLRKKIGPAVMNYSPFRDIDLVVPCSKIREIYYEIERIVGKYGLEYTAFGHIGDGNFHVNILYGNIPAAECEERTRKAVTEIHMVTARLGGAISGEHGIGHIQAPYLELTMDKNTIDLMKNIKNLMDPNGIMNANKIFNL